MDKQALNGGTHYRLCLCARELPNGNVACALICEMTGQRDVKVISNDVGLTGAMCRRCIAAVKRFPKGCKAIEIISDSRLFSGQFYSLTARGSLEVGVLALRLRRLTDNPELKVDVFCIPDEDNPAWRLLKRHLHKHPELNRSIYPDHLLRFLERR